MIRQSQTRMKIRWRVKCDILRTNNLHMKTPYILLVVATCIFSACKQPKSSTSETKKQKHPNIVLIVSDDHGQGDLGCYGNKAIHTPNLDNLASEGVKFTNAHCTSASCSASRSVILTGLYNHANGHYGHGHHFHHFQAFNSVKSLPVLLQELGGYKTARVGKYHVAPENIFHFEHVLDANARNPVAMAESCRNFIHSNKNNPFFLYFCTDDPHRCGNTENTPLAPNLFGNREEGYDGVLERKFKADQVIVPEFLPDSKESRSELAQYYQSVARMDQGIGKLFEHLKEANVWENTIIVYISDNGIAFEGAKTNHYQPAINLPCLLKTNNKEDKGKTSLAYINWADITPTLLDYAGILKEASVLINNNYRAHKTDWDNTHSPEFHGRSFKAALANDTLSGWDETFASHTFHEVTMFYPMRTIISKNYKLIWNLAYQLPYPQAQDLWESSTWQSALKSESQKYGNRTIDDIINRSEFELFNLVEDPFEINNLAYQKEYNTILQKLKTKILYFQKRTSDPWMVFQNR